VAGRVENAPGKTWLGIDLALRFGYRGLPGGTTVSRLLDKAFGPSRQNPPLSVAQVVHWAKAHRRRTGNWPRKHAGRLPEAPYVSWIMIDHALRDGKRGLPRCGSLLRFLEQTVGRPLGWPRLTEERIIKWADAHFRRAGRWPGANSGKVHGEQAETWSAINSALTHGRRGLRPGRGLAKLLQAERHAVGRALEPVRSFSVKQILAWADAHYRRTGKWPTQRSGRISEPPHFAWSTINGALRDGHCGVRPGSSLPILLRDKRGAPCREAPRFEITQSQILTWADAHHRQTGQWPVMGSGRVRGHPHLTWFRVNSAMIYGHRGLSAGGSLRRLLYEHRGVRNRIKPPPLSLPQILAWIRAHHRRTRLWPTLNSGPVIDAPGETWSAIDAALTDGLRGLRRRFSVSRLVARLRAASGEERRKGPLKPSDIILWAKAHHWRTGEWPHHFSGRVLDARGETWIEIDDALRRGWRGLPRSSLEKFLSGRLKPAALPYRATERQRTS